MSADTNVFIKYAKVTLDIAICSLQNLNSK